MRKVAIAAIVLGAALLSSAQVAPKPPTDFTSNIPILVLKSDRAVSVSTGDTYTPFTMDIYEPGASGSARLADRPTKTVRTGVRLRGMVSRMFPKLSYRLKLRDDKGATQGQALFGMPADADWVLQGPWLDKSLIRNALSYDLARAMGASGMRTRVCEVFLNKSGRPLADSDYVGVYQVTEDIERGSERVKLTALGPADNAEPAISGGYLLDWDVGDGTRLPRWSSIFVKYPKDPTRAQLDWIDRAITRFDQALKGPDSRDPVKGYASQIEVNDWVNYILVEELAFNLDAYVRSFYLQKDRGAKIRPGPVWDFDLGLGHQFQNGTSFTQWWFVGRHAPNGWVPRLMDDPAFVAKMAQRWRDLRKSVLGDDQISARVDANAAPLLKGAADRNFKRWPVLNEPIPFTMGGYITIATTTYPEQIAFLKTFLRQRAAWIDRALNTNLSQKSEVKSQK